MDDEAVEAVGDRRAGWAAGRVVRAEHEVVHEQLRALAEQVGQRGFAVLGLEAVVLLDGHPRQRLALPGDRVAAAGRDLPGLEQLEAGREPLLARCGGVGGHRGISFWMSAMAPTAHIRGRLMGSSATRAAISPRLEPTHHPPNRRPERRSSRQRRRQARFSGVSSYRTAAATSATATAGAGGRYSAYVASPTPVHTTRYEPANSGAARAPSCSRTRRAIAGTALGSIIAAIIGPQLAVITTSSVRRSRRARAPSCPGAARRSRAGS